MTAAHGVRILDQRTAEERDRPFLPGAGRTWLLPLYDVLSRLAGVGELHRRASGLAGTSPGQSVVDVGCGTGNLALAVLAAEPAAQVTGLDPDGAALRRAARKARRRGLSLTLVQGYADRVPAEDGSLDHVVTSLALHHLDDEDRAAFARDALRALRPGGRITVADFGGRAAVAPGGDQDGHGRRHGHGAGHSLRHLPGLLGPHAARHPTGTRSGDDDALTALLAGAGFRDAREVDHVEHRFGRVTFVQATRP